MNTNLVAYLTFLLLLLARAVHANTEKVIFQAPSPKALPQSLLALNEPSTIVLSSDQPSVRVSLPVAFPTAENPRGLEYWYLLRHLNPKQRYEVRVCWAAIQPTEFWLDVFEVDKFDKISRSLEAVLQSTPKQKPGWDQAASDHTSESVLALRIQAAANFFTSNRTLMRHPPPVDVDVILDPYLWSVFPTSLLPTAAYLIILAILGYFVSGYIWTYLQPTTTFEKPHAD